MSPAELAQLLRDSPSADGSTLARTIIPQGVPLGTAPMVPPPNNVIPFPAPAVAKALAEHYRTVDNPGPRTPWNDIYSNPKDIAARAAAQTSEESPNLSFYFPGTSRESQAELGSRRLDPADQMMWNPAAKARGSDASSRVMTPANEQRLLDITEELRTGAPDMFQGMKGWYPMDPAYKMMVDQRGKEEADPAFRRLMSMAFYSPMSNVPLEINRGTAGLMFNNMGRTDEFSTAGMKNELMAKLGYPLVMGNLQNKNMARSQADFIAGGMTPQAMAKALSSGNPKVPLYYQASLPPELGGQSRWMVPDAHATRGLGFGDVRPWVAKRVKFPDGTYGSSGKMVPDGSNLLRPEYTPIAPWFANKLSDPSGLEPTAHQAILWGGLGPITGVDTPLGASKLELFSDRINQTAEKLGITSPADKLKFRDQVLWGEKHSDLSNFAPVG